MRGLGLRSLFETYDCGWAACVDVPSPPMLWRIRRCLGSCAARVRSPAKRCAAGLAEHRAAGLAR